MPEPQPCQPAETAKRKIGKPGSGRHEKPPGKDAVADEVGSGLVAGDEQEAQQVQHLALAQAVVRRRFAGEVLRATMPRYNWTHRCIKPEPNP